MNDYKAFIECPNDMDDIYKNIEEYNQKKKRKILIAFWWYDCWYVICFPSSDEKT